VITQFTVIGARTTYATYARGYYRLQVLQPFALSLLVLCLKIADNVIQVDLAFVHLVSFAPITVALIAVVLTVVALIAVALIAVALIVVALIVVVVIALISSTS
jgi:hypothetical protein